MLTGVNLGLQRSLHLLPFSRHFKRYIRLLNDRAFSLSNESPNSLLSYEVRNTMRRVPHPLMIITATTPKGHVVGLLVSSFNTVSLNPTPLVSFNLKLPSSTFDAITTSNSFTVTAASTAKMAQAFTKHNVDRAHMAKAGLDTSRSCLDDGLFHMSCHWWKEKSVEVEDHMIMVGRVLTINQNSQWKQDQTAVIYSDGKYRHIGEPLVGNDTV